MLDVEFRLVERDSFCRACDRLLKRHEGLAICFYSLRNRGQHIKICQSCVEGMYAIIGEYESVHKSD